MEYAVSNYGPAAVIIRVSNTFYSYRNGVFYDQYCSSSNSLHAVLVVGYGTENGKVFKNKYVLTLKKLQITKKII